MEVTQVVIKDFIEGAQESKGLTQPAGNPLPTQKMALSGLQ